MAAYSDKQRKRLWIAQNMKRHIQTIADTVKGGGGLKIRLILMFGTVTIASKMVDAHVVEKLH